MAGTQQQHRRRQSREYWKDTIAQHESSTESVADFCETRDIGVASFYAWRRRIRSESAATDRTDDDAGFVEIRQPARFSALRIQCGDFQIDVDDHMNDTLLLRVLRSVQSVACSREGA